MEKSSKRFVATRPGTLKEGLVIILSLTIVVAFLEAFPVAVAIV
jgi:hypothetical protein